MWINLVCLACTYQEFLNTEKLEEALSQTLPTQCFTEKMRSQGVPEYWTNAIQTAQVDLKIKYYFNADTVVGYMDESTKNVFLNRRFHRTFSTCTQASNIAHETLHVLGFRHFVDSAYAVNSAFEACCVKP